MLGTMMAKIKENQDVADICEVMGDGALFPMDVRIFFYGALLCPLVLGWFLSS